MLTSMIKIDDLNSAGKVLRGEIPDPLGSIADDDLLPGSAPASFPSLEVQSSAKLLSGLDGSGVSGGVRIANGVAILVPTGLCKHATELGLAGVGGLAIAFTLSAYGFL